MNLEVKEIANEVAKCYFMGSSGVPVFDSRKFLDRLPAVLEAAGYRRCTCTGEWPLLTDEQLLEADGKLGEEYFDELDEHKSWLMDRRNIAQAQRDADMKRCPAQQE